MFIFYYILSFFFCKQLSKKYLKRFGAVSLIVGILIVPSIILAGWSGINDLVYETISDMALIFNGYTLPLVVPFLYKLSKKFSQKAIVSVGVTILWVSSIKVFIAPFTKLFFWYSLPLSIVALYMIISTALTLLNIYLASAIKITIECLAIINDEILGFFAQRAKDLLIFLNKRSKEEFFEFKNPISKETIKINCFFILKIFFSICVIIVKIISTNFWF